jgi:hypothetical protein
MFDSFREAWINHMAMNEQEALSQLRDTVSDQERQIAQLEMEIYDLEREVDEFRQRYDQRVGFAEKRVEAARDVLNELQRQNAYQTNFTPVEEQFQQRWGKLRSASRVEEIENAFTSNSPTRPNRVPEIPEDIVEEVNFKRLYRGLARKFHPDFAKSEADREQRTRLMSFINDAYARGDIETLLLVERGEMSPDVIAQISYPPAPDKALLILELQRLRSTKIELAQQIEILKARRADLVNSDWMQLKLEEKLLKMRGRDFFSEVLGNINKEFADIQTKIDIMRSRRG